ncbi:MAG TPA: hypothetical protein V6D43_00370 [Candidatus Sericytochromatia bacterium]
MDRSSGKEAIAFEDSGSGIEAAVGAGIYTIGVASSHEPCPFLELMINTQCVGIAHR